MKKLIIAIFIINSCFCSTAGATLVQSDRSVYPSIVPTYSLSQISHKFGKSNDFALFLAMLLWPAKTLDSWNNAWSLIFGHVLSAANGGIVVNMTSSEQSKQQSQTNVIAAITDGTDNAHIQYGQTYNMNMPRGNQTEPATITPSASAEGQNAGRNNSVWLTVPPGADNRKGVLQVEFMIKPAFPLVGDKVFGAVTATVAPGWRITSILFDGQQTNIGEMNVLSNSARFGSHLNEHWFSVDAADSDGNTANYVASVNYSVAHLAGTGAGTTRSAIY